MIVGSFDVGIKNLAFCIWDGEKRQILKWEVVSMPTKSEEGIFGELKHILESRMNDFKMCDVIVVERQPTVAKRIMCGIQYFIQGYFTGTGIRAIDFDPAMKVHAPGRGGKAYRNRKKMSVDMCKQFILENCREWVEFFNKHAKKDDLADTIMQALAFLRSADTEPPRGKTRPPTARKPTPNQRETRYSRSNLVWLWKNESREALKNNKRFLKDLNLYWRGVDQFVEELGE